MNFSNRMAAATVAILALGSAAQAKGLIYATRANNFTSTSTTPIAIPLDDVGSATLTFTTTKPNRLVRIIYNAECGVLGTGSAWAAVQITVDGALAAPASGTGFAFCSATSAIDYTWLGATRQSIAVVPNAGTHTVQVLANGNNFATNWWLGDTSLVIEQ